MHTTHSQPTMLRETRHLWVGNLPENIREERIFDHFKRYGKVQNVRILPKSSSESNGTGLGPNCSLNGTMLCNGVSATVAFIDIKSAAKAHSCENKIEERTLKTDYYEPPRNPYHDELQHPAPVKSNAASALASSTFSGSLSVSSTVATVAASSSTVAAASSTSSAAPNATSTGVSQPSITSTSASSSSSVPSVAASSSSASSSSSSTSPATSLPSNAALFGRHTPSRISEERYESRERNCANSIESRDSASYLLKSRNTSYHDDESPSYSSRNRSSRESSVSSRASFVGNATSSNGNRNVSSSTGINSYPDIESHGSNSTAAHEPITNASSSHHGTSSVSYQNLPGASSTQDNLSTSTSSSHSNDREEVKPTCAICVRNFPTRSTESNLKEGLYHEFKRYGRIVGMRFFDQGPNRHAIVVFKKVEEAERALNDSKDKQFFGNRIEVTFCEAVELDENESATPMPTTNNNSSAETNNKSEMDEYHPRATRTLFVGNLDKDITKSDLTNKFSQFGEILEIDIKSQQHQPYAFIQFTDISSVVKAMRKYDGETMGATRLKCGFGKSFPSSCIWLCDNNDAKERAFADEKVITHLRRYGNVKNHVFARDMKSALIFFESSDEARKAVEELHNKFVNGRKVQVDFASRDFQNFFIGKCKGDDTHRVRSNTSGWISSSSMNSSLDYEERTAYETSRNRSSMYHQHQTPSRSSSSSMSSQLMRSNSGTSSSYPVRQRSQSPSSSPATLSNFGRFSSSTVNMKNSKYDYHHESSSSSNRLSSRPYRYENDDIDDMGEDSHLSSSSKRESSSSSSRYRSHHLSDNYLSENSPKVRRDSSPYGSYGTTVNKSEAEFGSSRSSSRPSNVDDLKGTHDDSHSSLRRLNSHKSYHKSGRDSPPLPPSHSSQSFRKSGLASSSSSTSSSSRSPVRDSKSSSFYLDRTSVSPITSPRNSGHSFHDGDSQNDLSAHSVNKLDKDYNSQSSWRRKSTEDSAYYRDYPSGDVSRNRSESISESNDSPFAGANSTRGSADHGRDYYRGREPNLHRTNSSPSASLTYQNRSDALKRKHSTLESDEDSAPGTVQERKKRLMAACLDPASFSVNSNATSSNATTNQTPSGQPTTPLKSISSVDQRLTSSKSMDGVPDVNGGSRQLMPPVKQLRDSFPSSSIDILKRRSSSSSSSSSVVHNPLVPSGGNGSSSTMFDLKSKSDLKELLTNMTIPFSGEEEGAQIAKSLIYNLMHSSSLLQDGKTAAATLTPTTPVPTTTIVAAAAQVVRKPSLSGSIAPPSNGCSAAKPKALGKETTGQVSAPKFVDATSSLINLQPDPRTSGHSSRKLTTSRTSCDNDLSKHKPFDPLSSSSLSSSSLLSHPYGPASPMIMRLPEFAFEFIHSRTSNSTDSKSLLTPSSVVIASSSTITSSVTTTTTTTTTPNTLTPSCSLTHINIPTFSSTTTTTSHSPKSSNTIMSPLGSHSPVPKSRLSRDRLSTDTNSIDSKKPNDLDDVSDSDISPLRTSSLDDQIKALDEKYNAWSGTAATTPTSLKAEKTPTIDYSKYNIKKKSQSSMGNSTASLGSSAESESSDIFKNLLSKSSVFDQDSKRLEHINEKYEPRKDLDLENILSSPKSKVVNTFIRTKSLSSSSNKEPPTPLLPTVNLLSHSSFKSNSIGTGPTEKSAIESSSSLSKASLPTTTPVASSQPSASSLSSTTTPHFNHQQHHHHHHSFSSSSSSSSNAIPTPSSSMSRKLSDPSRVSSLKKDSSSHGSTSNTTPVTPCSAPVRSTSSSMFPQFHRSSSIPITTTTLSTPTATSSLARSAFPPSKNLFAVTGNTSTLTPGKPDKCRVELGLSKSLSMSSSDRKDMTVNKKESLTVPACVPAKPDMTIASRKDSITKHSAPKPDFFKNNKSENSFKSEIPAFRKDHKHSVESDHALNHMENELTTREKFSGSDFLKHSNKERDEHKEHRKSEKDAAHHKSEKHKEKSSDGHSSMSNHNHHGGTQVSKDKESKEKMDRKLEKNLLKEKERKKKEKERLREKELKDNKESSGFKDKDKEMRHKAKMMEHVQKNRSLEGREKDGKNREKDKDKSFDKEKRKEKHKEKKPKEGLSRAEIKALLDIPDTDEPKYFSMYDKVKARSQNNQKNTVNSSDKKFNQLAHKRHGGHRKDGNHSSDDSGSDSENDEMVKRPKKKLMQKRKMISSDESSEEEVEIAPKRIKKANVNETDSESESAKAARADKYAKQLLDFTDDSSENEEKKAAAAGTLLKKKNKKLKKDKEKERPNDIGSPVKEKADRHETHEKMKEKEKEKEHQKSKKNKAERKEKEREMEKDKDKEMMKREARVEKEKRSKSEDEEQSSKMVRIAKKKKKKAKDKSSSSSSSSSKEKRLLGSKEDAKDGKVHLASSDQPRKPELTSDEDMSSSDQEDAASVSNVLGPNAVHSDSDNDTRTHLIKCYNKEMVRAAVTEAHRHNDKDSATSKEQSAKENSKMNNLLDKHFAPKEKADKIDKEKSSNAGDRSPTKKNDFFSLVGKKSQKHFIKSEDENESSCKEIVKKKKKSSKSKDKDKLRKDSESSDSKKSEKRDMPDLSSNDSCDVRSCISPQRIIQQQPQTKIDFKSLLLPDLSASVKEPSTPSPPPKTPEVLSSRSSSYTEDLGLVHRDRDDGSSSDSRLDEELMNDARKLEECMMAKNDDSYDSNLSGSNSPLNSTSKTLHQTDLTNLLPQLVPTAFSADCSLDSKTLPSFYTPPQRCYDEEAAIQSLKLQKELESKDSEHLLKPTFDSLPPFSRFPTSTNEKPIVEEPVFTETTVKVPEDPTLFITAEIESNNKITIPPHEDSVKCSDFNEMESQRNIEDDLAVAALLQDMNDPIHAEPGTHDRSSIDQALPDEMPNFLNILAPRASSDGDRPDSLLLTAPSAQAQIIVTSPIVPPIIAAPEISIDDHELNAAVHEIELSCPPPIQHKEPPIKTTGEVMFNDDDDDEPALMIVDETALEKSLLDDSDPRPPLTNTKKTVIMPPLGIVPFGVKPFTFEPSICLPKSSTASIADIIKDSIKDSIKAKESIKAEEVVKPVERSEHRTIDLHMSMPILTSAFDTKIQTETVPIKERTRSTDSDRPETIKSPFASFLSPRSMHSDTAPAEKKSVVSNDQSFADIFTADDKRDSCSESVVSDKTEIEEESASESLFNENCKLSAATTNVAVKDDEPPSSSTIETKNSRLNKLSEESEPECESLPPKPKRGRKPKNRKSSDSSLHSPRSDVGLEQHGPMTSLSINTNLTCSSGTLLLSPTSNSNASSTTTTSDISPGSQAKRGGKQQQHSSNYGIRRSVRTAAVAATVANSNTALELDDTDFSLDEMPPYNNKDEQQPIEEEHGVKKSKRGRKKKNLGNAVVEHVAKNLEEDKSKKERHLHTINAVSIEHRPTKSSSANNLYDVFEFRESDEDEPMIPMQSTHFMSSTAEEKRHPEQQLQPQQQPSPSIEPPSSVSPPKAEAPVPALTLPIAETVPMANAATAANQLGANSNAMTSAKEYVSEMNQHGKHGGISMIIRLQQKDGQDCPFSASETTTSTTTITKSVKNLIIEDSKSNDGLPNSVAGGAGSQTECTNSIKGVRKSARLMSQVPKTTVEDTIEDVIKTKEDKANASKRITRSYRKSDDTNNAQLSGEISEESDDPKNGSHRPFRVTRSRGPVTDQSDTPASSEASTIHQQPRTSVNPAVTSPPPPRTPKKSTDSMEHTEVVVPPLVQSTPTLIEVPLIAKPSPPPVQLEAEQQQLHQQQEESTSSGGAPLVSSPKSTVPPIPIAIAPVANTAGESKKVEPPPSVIHSTGNVEKIPSVGTIVAASPTVITSTAALSSTASTSSASVIATAAPPQPAFSSPVITSPTYHIQDIPNISERIHHSSTALKLKTGKGYFFEASSMPISMPTVSTPSESSPSIVSVTPVTPSVITPPTSISPKVTEGAPPAPTIAASSTIMPAIPSILGSQSITIKPKTQPPVGPSLNQLPTTDMWPIVSTAGSNKTYISPALTSAISVPSTVSTIHTPSSFTAESSVESTTKVQPPPAHLSKLPLNVVAPQPHTTTINELSKGINLVSLSMPTSVVTSHQSPATEMAGKASSVPVTVMHTINKTVPSKPSVVQVAGAPPPLPLVPPELAAHLGAFPPHLVAANPHLAAEYLSAQQSQQQQQQQYLSSLQKQQQQHSQILSSPQPAPGNRTLKPTDPSPGFVSPSASHFSTAELQQQAAAAAAANVMLPSPFAGLPPHLRPPVSSATGQPMLVPRPGAFGMPNDLGLDLLAHQQFLSMYSQIAPELRNGPNTLSRPPIQLPRYMFPTGIPFAGLSQETIAELVKDQAKLQEEHSKQQQKQLQQQQNAAKKDDNHHRAPQQTVDELKQHHIVEPPFHLDGSSMPPPGQRNVTFPANMRPYHYPMPQQDRFGAEAASLMHPMYGINGQRVMPISAHGFAVGTSNPTDLSKQGSSQSSSTASSQEPLKRSSTVKPVQDAAYSSPMHRQLSSPSAHSPAYRKDLPMVQEPTTDLIRSQMAGTVVPAPGSLPLNMSSQLNQRPPSRPPSTLVQSTHSLSRPSSESSIVEQPPPQPPMVPNRQPAIHSPAISSEPHLVAPHPAHAISTPIQPPSHGEPSQQAPQPGSTAPNSHTILQKYPILWHGLLALKNDQVSVQMHFVSGNRSITNRALPSFSEVNMQPLRITQRMRIDQTQLQALERKIQSNDEFCILLALPCGRDSGEVMLQSANLKRFFINYLQSKQAAGIVNTNDEVFSYITHIFPSCEFSDDHLVRVAPDLLHSLQGISHLMVVITSNPPNSTNTVY